MMGRVLLAAATILLFTILLSLHVECLSVNLAKRRKTWARNAQSTVVNVPFAETPIDNNIESSGKSVGERVKIGESVVQLYKLVAPQEQAFLIRSCLEVASQATPTTALDKPGLVRLPTLQAAARATATKTPCSEALPKDVDVLLMDILKRITQFIDEFLPSLSTELFGTDSITDLLASQQLSFSSREPAINVYTKGGEFLAHKDAQALTILLPLSCPSVDFSGGGTAFWSQDARGHRVEDPSVVVTPTGATALLFGGCVTHAGCPVEDGQRVVYVASFSKKGDAPQMQHRDIYGDSL